MKSMVLPTCLHSDVETSWRTINKRVHRRRQCESFSEYCILSGRTWWKHYMYIGQNVRIGSISDLIENIPGAYTYIWCIQSLRIFALLKVCLPLLHINVLQHSRKIWYARGTHYCENIILFFSHIDSSQSIYWELCDDQPVSINTAVKKKKKWNLCKDLQTTQYHEGTDEISLQRRIFIVSDFTCQVVVDLQ